MFNRRFFLWAGVIFLFLSTGLVHGVSLKSVSKSEISNLVKEYKKTSKDSNPKTVDLSQREESEDENKSKAYIEENKQSQIEEMFKAFAVEELQSIVDPDLQSDEKGSVLGIEGYGSSQFGYSFFRHKITTQFEDVPVGPDYILGPGDSLRMYLWGLLEDEFEVTLDKEGFVFLPRVGRLNLSGIRFGDVESVVNVQLSKQFSNFKLSISIASIRSIKVYLMGDVRFPGEYNVSSLTSVFQAVHLAGGPTKMGSMRKIQVVRRNKKIANVDLYSYFTGGVSDVTVSLNDLDTIFIPPIGEVVKISGTVKRPSIYEIKRGSSVYDLIQLSGGLTAATYFNRVQIKRIVKGESQLLIDEIFKDKKALKRQLRKQILEDGDWVKVLPISSLTRENVFLKGNVARPGQYELKKGMTLSDLISTAQGLLLDTYLDRVEVYRFVSDHQREIISVNLAEDEGKDFELEEWDSVVVYSNYDVFGGLSVSVRGAVQRAGNYNLFKNMRIRDLLFKSRPNAFANLKDAELVRTSLNGSRTVIKVDISRVLSNDLVSENIVLRPFDQLVVREAVHDMEKHQVIVSGEVRYPDKYTFVRGEKLSSLLDRAGGFTSQAFLKGIVFIRRSSKERAVEAHNRLIKEEQQRFIYETIKVDEKEMGSSSMVDAKEMALEFLKEQSQDYKGRVVLAIGDYENFKGSEDDLVLENGDSIFIPPIPSTIQVIGGVQSPSSVIFVDGKSSSYYVSKLGGYTSHASKRRQMVLKANGMISSDLSRIDRGDVIFIPEKFKIPITWRYIVRSTVDVLKSVSDTVLAYILVQSAINNL